MSRHHRQHEHHQEFEFEFEFEARPSEDSEVCVPVTAKARACHPLWCWHPPIDVATGKLSAEWLTLSHVPSGLPLGGTRLAFSEVCATIVAVEAFTSDGELSTWDETTPLKEHPVLGKLFRHVYELSDGRAPKSE